MRGTPGMAQCASGSTRGPFCSFSSASGRYGISCPSTASVTSNAAALRVSQMPCRSGLPSAVRGGTNSAVFGWAGASSGATNSAQSRTNRVWRTVDLAGILFGPQNNHLAVGEREPLAVAGMGAVLGQKALDGDLHAGLQTVFLKPAAVQSQ